MFVTVKRYEFSMAGYEQAIRDINKEKYDLGFEIVFWSIMLSLCGFGTMSVYTLLKLSACSITSKTVKWMIRRNKV